MLSRTLNRRFFKDDRSRGFGNPMRRWVYHYVVAGIVAAAGGLIVFAYQRAKWEAARYADTRGEYLCGSSMADFLTLLPFNRLSNAFGSVSEAGQLPAAVHQYLIKRLIKYYQVDMTESAEQHFESLQDFYVREWRPECRPVASGPSVVAVAPCDGQVMSVQENVTGTTLTQVKGLTYGIQSLMRTTFGEVPKGRKRVAAVIHLCAGDFHHVIAPAAFNCAESIYVPGCLLPTTGAGMHWIPSVLTLNERVIVHGTMPEEPRKATSKLFFSASATSSPSQFAMALVGGTLSGKIKLAFDQRIRTNFLDPPEYAVYTPYASCPLLPAGSRVGTFFWGSTVVVVMDVPKDATFIVRAGQTVKAGEPFLQVA